MSLSADERALLRMIVVTFAATHLAVGLPVWVWLPAAITLIGSLRPSLILVAVLLVVSVRSHGAIEALEPAATRPIEHEWVELVSDPRPGAFGWSGEAELGSDRLRVEANRADLSRYAQGDRLLVSGVVVGAAPRTDWQRSRRLVGSLRVTGLHESRTASGPVGWATSVRTALADGARSLGPPGQALFTGLVFGDDRRQDPLTADDFRAAGLGHLLAVSGQNVLFVLVLVAPVLSRVESLPARLLGTAAVLVAFGFLTRFEPSVVRALAMAGIVATAAARGSPMGAVRVLPVALLALVLLDPLLSYSLAFQLSVAATTGLIVISPRLEEFLPGRTRLGQTAAATVGAQVAVAPLLLAHFGTISLLALPANVLAAPAAAFVMMWGLTAGMVAGLAPESVAVVLHLPTVAAIGWIEWVARRAADTPVGAFGLVHMIVAAAGVLVVSTGHRSVRAVGVIMVAGAVLIPLLFSPTLGAGRHRLATGVELVRSSQGHDVVILERSGGVETVLQSLRTARVGRIDLLVTSRGDRGAGALVGAITERFVVTDVWAPPLHNVPGARVRPVVGGRVGPLRIEVGLEDAVSVTELGRARG